MQYSTAPSDPRLPRYQQIRDDVAARIARGEWQGGECIPSESDFALSYSVSVGTIRKAVDRLEADGLIERLHGRGMFVRRADFTNSLFRFFRLTAEDGRAIIPQGVILERAYHEAPAQVRDRLGLEDGRSVRLLRLRRHASKTLLREEIWLPAALFDGIVELEVEALSPLLYPAYERHFGKVIARARERLSVDVADRAIARDLAVAPGDTVMRVERLAFDHRGRPLEWRVSHGPATDFSYEVDVQ